jgi:hypothetical protein
VSPTYYPCRLDSLVLQTDDEFSDLYDASTGKLYALDDFILYLANPPSIALDPALGLPYNAPVSIPELDLYFGLTIPFRFTARNAALFNHGPTRATLCVQRQTYFTLPILNSLVTLTW